MSNILTLLQHPKDVVRELILAELQTKSLKEFVKGAWHIHHGKKPLMWNKHIDILCEHLEAVLPGRQIRRLLINVPPGFLKSLLVSVYWPAWLWITEPNLQILAASASHDVALRDAKRQHEIVGSEWFQRSFIPRWHFDKKQDAKGYFANTMGGYRISRSVGQKVIGFRGDLSITDDPIDAQDAHNDKVALKSHGDWFNQSWRTRVNSPVWTPLVIIMQRLHQLDLSGIVLEQGGFEHICLPNEYDSTKRFTILYPEVDEISYDWRTEEGELLHPKFLNEQGTAEKRNELGGRAYAGQYQQTPAPAEGTVIKGDWLQAYDPRQFLDYDENVVNLEKFDYTVHSWDFSFKRTTDADYTVGQVWGVIGSNRYLIDQCREKMNLPDCIKAMIEMDRRYPGARAKLVEGRANGPAVVYAVKNEVYGIIEIEPYGSKEARVASVLPQFEALNVWIPHRSIRLWVDDFIEEHTHFPAARRDDQVDASSQALYWMSKNDFHGSGFFTL